MNGLSRNTTTAQQARITERGNSLRRRVNAWFEIRDGYIPGSSQLRLSTTEITGSGISSEIYDVALWLPSQIMRAISCPISIQESEWALRIAQATDSLEAIRTDLRLLSFMTKDKKDWSRGVRANTRAGTAISNTRQRIRNTGEVYRTARAAIHNLSPLLQKGEQWTTTFRHLTDSDLTRLPVDRLDVGEGTLKISWIWTTTQSDKNDEPVVAEGEEALVLFLL